MSQELASFQQYQLAFTQHLRAPKQHPRPKGAAAKGIAVYEEIVFNNIFESVSACFPVAQKVLGKRAWLKLVQGFMREYSANSPIFREIPEEFLRHLTNKASGQSSKQPPSQLDLPAYLLSLCHYEWIELRVSSDNTQMDAATIEPAGSLLEQQPVFNPTIQLLNYDYDVQNISARYKPTVQISTQLLVYRNAQDAVKFVELNPVTYQLIALLQTGNMTGKQALTQISSELGHSEPDAVLQFGLEILEDFKRQDIILGVHK